MEYVDRQWKECIFSEVAGTNMTKIGKVFADLRDELGIPYLDDYGQRRLLYSIRHSVCSVSMVGYQTFYICNRRSDMKRAVGLLSIICIYLRYPQSVMLLMVSIGNKIFSALFSNNVLILLVI